jgi:hypothetical protein
LEVQSVSCWHPEGFPPPAELELVDVDPVLLPSWLLADDAVVPPLPPTPGVGAESDGEEEHDAAKRPAPTANAIAMAISIR